MSFLGGKGVNLFEHLLVFRKPPCALFAPDLCAVDVHIEDPTGAFDQLRLDLELLPDRIRQTGGCRQIVSFAAVLDCDVHTRLHSQTVDVKSRSATKVQTPSMETGSAGGPTRSCAPHVGRSRLSFRHPTIATSQRQARFIVMRNSAFVRTLASWARSSSIDSTGFMSDRTRRRR